MRTIGDNWPEDDAERDEAIRLQERLVEEMLDAELLLDAYDLGDLL